MKEQPILMNSPMTLAILDGCKSQTRRLLTPQPLYAQCHEWHGEVLTAGYRKWWWRRSSYDVHIGDADRRHLAAQCPYGEPGNRLWVREGHYRFGHWEQVVGPGQRWRFVADSPEIRFDVPLEFCQGRYHKDSAMSTWHKRLARFMPRVASRLMLEITEVRVQLLQEISEEDARAEDVVPVMWERRVYPSGRAAAVETPSYRDGFGALWDTLNGRTGHRWSDNPFVWAITFRRLP